MLETLQKGKPRPVSKCRREEIGRASQALNIPATESESNIRKLSKELRAKKLAEYPGLTAERQHSSGDIKNWSSDATALLKRQRQFEPR